MGWLEFYCVLCWGFVGVLCWDGMCVGVNFVGLFGCWVGFWDCDLVGVCEVVSFVEMVW